jgi:hypothetical protein
MRPSTRVLRCKAKLYSWGDFPLENGLIFIRIELTKLVSYQSYLGSDEWEKR